MKIIITAVCICMAIYGLTLAEDEASTYYQPANYNSDGSYIPPSVADGYGGRVAVGPLRPEVAQAYNAANSAPAYFLNYTQNYTSSSPVSLANPAYNTSYTYAPANSVASYQAGGYAAAYYAPPASKTNSISAAPYNLADNFVGPQLPLKAEAPYNLADNFVGPQLPLKAEASYRPGGYNGSIYTPPSVADGYGGRVAVGPLRPEVAQAYNAANSAPVIPNYVYNEGFSYTSPLQNTPKPQDNMMSKTSSSPWLGTRVEGNTAPKPAEHKGGMYLFKQDYKIEKNTVNPQLQVGPHPGVNDSLRPVTVPIVILPKNEDYNIKK